MLRSLSFREQFLQPQRSERVAELRKLEDRQTAPESRRSQVVPEFRTQQHLLRNNISASEREGSPVTETSTESTTMSWCNGPGRLSAMAVNATTCLDT
jgi:hypothetical protein